MTHPTVTIPAHFTAAEYRAQLESNVACYTGLIDQAVAEGDDDSAAELLAAIETMCASLDILTAAGL